jgi:heat shock protein HslJ
VKGTLPARGLCRYMATRIALLVGPLFLAGCLSHPPPPGAPYHAAAKGGQWNLIIDEKHITFIRQGQQPIRQPTPQVIGGIAGEIYQTPRIGVNIVHGACAIGDRTYADRVQVYVDGVQHEGCGGH